VRAARVRLVQAARCGNGGIMSLTPKQLDDARWHYAKLCEHAEDYDEDQCFDRQPLPGLCTPEQFEDTPAAFSLAWLYGFMAGTGLVASGDAGKLYDLIYGRFTVNGEPCPIEDFVADHVDRLDPNAVARIIRLPVGESITVSSPTGNPYTLTRIE
jgi:hypothetical protein